MEALTGEIAVERQADRDFRIVASGTWTPGYADTHFGQLKAMLSHARTTEEGVRVLVDLRAAAVQSTETAERVRYWTSTIYEERDRVAMLVRSSLVKQQMRRVAVIATRELFISESAAHTWLHAA